MQAASFDSDYTKSPHWQQQVKLAQLSRQTNAPHTYARSAAVASRSGNLVPLTVAELAVQLSEQQQSQSSSYPSKPAASSKITPATNNIQNRANGTINPQQKNAKLEEERQRLINEQINKQFWTALDLGGQGLCRLSNRLFGYSFLQKLYLNHNKLMVLPSSIVQLNQLKVLDLSDNLLTELPPELGVMFNLRYLFCFDNRIQTLPFEFGFLFQLEVLGLEGNPLNEHMRDLLAKEGTRGLIVELREKAPVTVESHPREWLMFETPDSSTTEANDADGLSFLSYNTLCDHYATPQLYGYTPSWALGWKYRSDLLSAEVMALDTDVICLQEVDRNSFDDFWVPQLKEKGYEGVHTPKTRAKTMDDTESRKVDGCATFWRKSKLRVVAKYGLEYNTLALKREDFKKTADIYNRVMNKDNIALVVVFERLNAPPDQQLFVLANTHLHWNPAFKDVKLVQVGLLLEEIERILDKYASNSTPEGSKFPKYTDPKMIPMTICGDYNSTSDSGVYQLFCQNKVPPDHSDLEGRIYGKYTEEGIKHSLQIRSSYEEIGELPFTNYTPNFVKAIDYIWYTTPTINVTALLGPIDEEYTKHFVGFPNAHHPSDHIPIAAKFTFKKIKEPATKPPPPTFSRKT